MNILIVGNGFDLSHYLPTKYEHFMSVMENIGKWSKPNEDMCFDDIFDKENGFFQKTKSIYQVDKIYISILEIEGLRERLQQNVWYKFFSYHLQQIDTWIDFELEFSKALDLVAKFSEDAENIYQKHEEIRSAILHVGQTEREKNLKYGENTITKLFLLGLFEVNNNQMHIKNKYYRNQNLKLEIDVKLIIEDLEKFLNDFISIFKWYLQEVIQKLEPKNTLRLKRKDFEYNDLLVLSFNYTSTFSHFYSPKAKIEYVHGKVEKDLVLGIPDVKNEFLKKFKNYSFTKYHQKLLKNTDYLFLNENPTVSMILANQSLGRGLQKINIYVWGHSLAESDEDYIREIFSLNRKKDVECNVCVYFYDNDAPQLLNNLLDILGKAIVEEWMKKGWLKFEENPDIAKLNGIEPVDLPKISAS